MTVSYELIISVVIQLIAVGIFIGVYKTTIAFMQKQLEEIKQQIKDDKTELKADMKKYNNVLERIAVAENSISAAHHRIDNIEDKL
jgi:septal ring factor EnvC (AmiA/AmiB activator)